MTVYTIGHSTRPLDEFIELLRSHGVAQLADVRTVPKSRRHPHFAADALSQSLDSAGIVYRHAGELGGLRKPAVKSRNMAWRHEGFRGYADYMETAAFEGALDALVDWSREARTTVMCAEALWWRCHRQLIADALVARGLEVRHIMSARKCPGHTLTAFARVNADRVTYPGLI